MALTKFTENVNNIQALADIPDNLTSSELKEAFDKAGADIKSYINNTLTDEIDNNLTAINQTISNVEGEIPTDYVREGDVRLSNSRRCNNSFDNWATARTNLKISYGTSLPANADNGAIFIKY